MLKAPKQSQSLEAKAGSGQAMVEFAFMLLLLMIVLCGILDFTRALYVYNFVSEAAHEATRYAIVRGGGTNSACTITGTTPCPACTSDITTYVTGLAMSGINTSQLSVPAVYWNGVAGTGSGGCPAAPNNNPGNSVQVTVQYNFNFLFGVLKVTTIPMTSTSQMVIQQ
jgi:Flp pilus assembly protein TadG